MAGGLVLSVHVEKYPACVRRTASGIAHVVRRGSRPRTDRALCMACCVVQYARKSIGIIKGRVLPRKRRRLIRELCRPLFALIVGGVQLLPMAGGLIVEICSGFYTVWVLVVSSGAR